MANRVTGMYSGMDTESLIQDLVKARSSKVTKLNKEKTKLEWKQEKWNDLNTKVKNLFSKTVSNLRWATTFSKKATTVSNTNAVSVITGEGAMDSVQNLSIKKLAKAGYLTGAKVQAADGSEVSGSTKVSELTGGVSTGSFDITTNGKTTTINIDADTTIDSVVSRLKSAGVNANFDAGNGRLFIGASTSGTKADFTITANNADGSNALSALGINAKNDAATEKYASLAAFKDMSLQDILDSGVDSDAYKALKSQMLTDDDFEAAFEKLNEKANFAATAEDISYSDAVKIDGENAQIELNGATFESATNNISVNGLTFTLNAVAEDITVTTQNDTDGIYDVVKNFIKEYNSIINEMDKLYNAASTKLEPLTDEEKDAVSEKEAEKLENQVKDSLLRRDDTLGTLFNGLRNAMSAGIEVNGKTMFLSNFGIETPDYISTASGERNAYHILGDEDDADFSGKTDKLKGMIASDSDTVISFFTQLGKNLYSKLDDLSAASNYSTYGSFFNDKQMKSDLSGYATKIATAEQELADYEDRYYDKFSKMEVALSKMNSNTNYLSGLFG